MKKRVILISKTPWDEKSKSGTVSVFYVLELNNITHRARADSFETEFNYVVKTIVKEADGSVLLNADGTTVGSLKAGNDIGLLNISAITTDPKTLGLTGTVAEIQQKLTAHYFKTYANEVEDYGFEWDILVN